MNDPVIITLSWSEIVVGANVGCMRQITNLRDRRRDRYELVEVEGFAKHIMGCHGEIAVAKYRNVFWSGALGNLAAPDVGAKIQVRATTYPQGRLVVHKPIDDNGREGDDPADYFILARVLLPQVHLVGWLRGDEAQQSKYWKALPTQPNRPAFFVDNDDVRSMSELPSLANVEHAA